MDMTRPGQLADLNLFEATREMARAVGNAAFARGARAVVLQAMGQGEPIYRRLGYREVTRYTWYVDFQGEA